MTTPLTERSGLEGDVGPEILPKRLMRFGDWAPIQDIDGEGSPRTMIFYHGDEVAERMALVRGGIVYVRENWKDYTGLMDGLRKLIQGRLVEPPSGDDAEKLEDVLSSLKEWIDRRERSIVTEEEEDYSVIRLYTSSFGYQHIFKIADTIFRTNEGFSRTQEDLYAAVFLVELLNVDLFNYVSVTNQADNFQGVVFRALAASNEQLQRFEELAARPVAERYWAIPLAIISASRNQETAMDYAREEVVQQPQRRLFLWRIHVVKLETELLRVYREKFPSSVVSTICAVPIREMSQFPQEDEVVLRGPFFQLIRMREEVLEGVGNVHVMDSVMLNVNRDHPSTEELREEEREQARVVIGTLVGMGRAKACKRLAEEYDLSDDAETYEQFYEEGAKRLQLINIQ